MKKSNFLIFGAVILLVICQGAQANPPLKWYQCSESDQSGGPCDEPTSETKPTTSPVIDDDQHACYCWAKARVEDDSECSLEVF